jgi:hypothetical protein
MAAPIAALRGPRPASPPIIAPAPAPAAAPCPVGVSHEVNATASNATNDTTAKYFFFMIMLLNRKFRRRLR